ncbi:MAG: hypothetical protein K2H06_04215 [Anaeroplasmataceae bacterium]|nr:hypothetical protein [Anaeroplasmataceae bacterium]
MEEKLDIIEEVTIDFKQNNRSDSIRFWKFYLKQSWPFYIFTVLGILIILGIGYIYKNSSVLYIMIIYFIAMVLLFVIEGAFRNLKYLRNLKKGYKNILVSIYPKSIRLTRVENGISYMNEYLFETMEKIFYDSKSNETVFMIKKDNYFSIDNAHLKEDTIQFLTTLFTEEKK